MKKIGILLAMCLLLAGCGSEDGLWTDERQNVLGMDKEPIPGLYATGNCCGRRWGVQYSTPIPGVSIGMAWTLGRLCGMHAAEDILQEEA